MDCAAADRNRRTGDADRQDGWARAIVEEFFEN